ncbi:MAG: TRAP transporter substrate-binding protein DctP [Gemmatimonadota bacterium]
MQTSESFRAARLLLAALIMAMVVWPTADAAEALKIATLAPEGSSWVQALRDIDAEVRERTDGAMGLRIYPGGVQGDEDVMLRKIRIGQLQGGGFVGLGASQVLPEVLALEMPFLFQGYDEVEYVLEQTGPFFAAGYEDAGYTHLGWADAGFVYLLSRQPVASREAIAGMKVWRLQGEPITEVLFAKAGVTSTTLAIPDVLLGLQTNLVEVVYASPAAAIVLQWFTRARYFTDLPVNYVVGSLLLDSRAFQRLPVDHQVTLREAAARHLAAQRRRSRADNAEALAVLEQQGLVRVTPTAEAVAEFKELVRLCEPELVGKAFTSEAYGLVLQRLEEYRQGARAHGVDP